MDLDKVVKIVPKTSGYSASESQMQLTMFDAVRRWTDEEGAGAFAIELDGKQMSAGQIEDVAHSQEYVDRLLAFDERR
jgi:hypothetical protein